MDVFHVNRNVKIIERERERERKNTYSKYFIMEHAHLILTSIHYCHFMVRINLPIIYGIVHCTWFDITVRFVSLESCIKIDQQYFCQLINTIVLYNHHPLIIANYIHIFNCKKYTYVRYSTKSIVCYIMSCIFSTENMLL